MSIELCELGMAAVDHFNGIRERVELREQLLRRRSIHKRKAKRNRSKAYHPECYVYILHMKDAHACMDRLEGAP